MTVLLFCTFAAKVWNYFNGDDEIHIFYIRIIFLRIDDAPFPKYQEFLKNNAEARLSDTNFLLLHISEYLDVCR